MEYNIMYIGNMKGRYLEWDLISERASLSYRA